MPQKKKSYGRKRIPARNSSRQQRARRKQVHSFPRQIQSSTFIPKNRLLKFEDYRSFVVTDSALGSAGSLPPLLQIGLNDPTQFIESTQGTWNSNSLGAKGSAVPGITKWLSNKIPGTTSTADYLTGSCLGARVTITCVPLPDTVSGDETYQDVMKCVLAEQTRFGHLKNRAIDTSFNVERVSQMTGVRTANIYHNQGGTPRGCTLTLKYSFKKANAHRGKQPENLFYADTSPVERDCASFCIMPGDSTGYGVTGNRCPPCRVQVKVSYIVLLSEVNTHIGLGINDGNNLSDTARIEPFD